MVSPESEPSSSTAVRAPRSPSAWRRLIPFARAGIATALVGLALALPASADAAELVHVVVKGQTLGRIAKRYRISVDTIRAVNDLKKGQMLRPGTRLVIPEKGKEAEAIKKAEAQRAARAEKQKKEKEREKAHGKDKGRNKDKGRDDAKDDESAEGYARKPKRPGFVHMERGTERFDAQLLTRHGRLVPSALPGISRMLRFGPTGAKIPIDPRLATLIGIVSDHFGGRVIHVVSGYRPFSPRQYTRHSKHNLGHAIDFNVEGVPNTVLRDFCRTFRSSGVGYYPHSSFVHMDVRTQKVYWVDYSGPGEAPRYDSQTAKDAADESTGDVDSTESGSEGGSNSTSTPDGQAPDSTGGNQNGRGLEAPPARDVGTNSPTPTPQAPAAPPSP